jgi:type IV secretory pathway VirB10-like protein
MNLVKAIAAVIVGSSSISGLSASWAADPEDQAKVAPTVARDDAEPAQPAEVLKTKTKSNQSNDRQAAPPPPKETPAANEAAEVLKTKTKSNQSND